MVWINSMYLTQWSKETRTVCHSSPYKNRSSGWSCYKTNVGLFFANSPWIAGCFRFQAILLWLNKQWGQFVDCRFPVKVLCMYFACMCCKWVSHKLYPGSSGHKLRILFHLLNPKTNNDFQWLQKFLKEILLDSVPELGILQWIERKLKSDSNNGA